MQTNKPEQTVTVEFYLPSNMFKYQHLHYFHCVSIRKRIELANLRKRVALRENRIFFYRTYLSIYIFFFILSLNHCQSQGQFSRRQLMIFFSYCPQKIGFDLFFLFSPENRFCSFMQIFFCLGISKFCVHEC